MVAVLDVAANALKTPSRLMRRYAHAVVPTGGIDRYALRAATTARHRTPTSDSTILRWFRAITGHSPQPAGKPAVAQHISEAGIVSTHRPSAPEEQAVFFLQRPVDISWAIEDVKGRNNGVTFEHLLRGLFLTLCKDKAFVESIEKLNPRQREWCYDLKRLVEYGAAFPDITALPKYQPQRAELSARLEPLVDNALMQRLLTPEVNFKDAEMEADASKLFGFMRRTLPLNFERDAVNDIKQLLRAFDDNIKDQCLQLNLVSRMLAPDQPKELPGINMRMVPAGWEDIKLRLFAEYEQSTHNRINGDARAFLLGYREMLIDVLRAKGVKESLLENLALIEDHEFSSGVQGAVKEKVRFKITPLSGLDTDPVLVAEADGFVKRVCRDYPTLPQYFSVEFLRELRLLRLQTSRKIDPPIWNVYKNRIQLIEEMLMDSELDKTQAAEIINAAGIMETAPIHLPVAS